MIRLSTQGLNDAQIETVTRAVISGDHLFWLAPFLVGFWLNALLFGVLIVLYVRWQTGVARTDKTWVKVIVYYLLVLHCGATGYSLGYQNYMFIEGFGKYKHFVNVFWARTSWIIAAASRIPCSAFFTYRAYVMYQRHWAILACVIPIMLGFTACAVGAVTSFEYMPLPLVTRQWILAMNSLALATDLTLTALLTTGLLRSKTKFEHTNRLIARILRTLIETQSPPTITAALTLIVTALWGDSSQVAYFHFAPRVYPICLLIILNARQEYSQMAQSHTPKTAGISFTGGLAMRSSDTGILVDQVTHINVSKVEDWTPYPFIGRGASTRNEGSREIQERMEMSEL